MFLLGNTQCKVTPECFIWENVTWIFRLCRNIQTDWGQRCWQVNRGATERKLKMKRHQCFSLSKCVFIIFWVKRNFPWIWNEFDQHSLYIGEFAQRRSPKPPGQKVTVEPKKENKTKTWMGTRKGHTTDSILKHTHTHTHGVWITGTSMGVWFQTLIWIKVRRSGEIIQSYIQCWIASRHILMNLKVNKMTLS